MICKFKVSKHHREYNVNTALALDIFYTRFSADVIQLDQIQWDQLKLGGVFRQARTVEAHQQKELEDCLQSVWPPQSHLGFQNYGVGKINLQKICNIEPQLSLKLTGIEQRLLSIATRTCNVEVGNRTWVD